eukprot:7071-Lingulodinium_polyedra.AAC.1
MPLLDAVQLMKLFPYPTIAMRSRYSAALAGTCNPAAWFPSAHLQSRDLQPGLHLLVLTCIIIMNK